MTMRFAYWLRSEYCEPPKPRLITTSGFMSSASVAHNAILEEPAKTMAPNLGGLILSCCSNLRIEGSQSWACDGALGTKLCLPAATPARHTDSKTKLARVLRTCWLIGWAMDCKLPLDL